MLVRVCRMFVALRRNATITFACAYVYGHVCGGLRGIQWTQGVLVNYFSTYAVGAGVKHNTIGSVSTTIYHK